jgi:hypothetical protein
MFLSLGSLITVVFNKAWPQGFNFSQLPSAVISNVRHPLESPSLLNKADLEITGGEEIKHNN